MPGFIGTVQGSDAGHGVRLSATERTAHQSGLPRIGGIDMDEKVKNKDADKAQPKEESRLDEGLEETFPGSDPVAATTPGDGGPEEKPQGE